MDTKQALILQQIERSGFAYSHDLIHAFIGGSELHGAKVKNTDDMDIYGVYIEPPQFALGLGRSEHYVWSTAGNERRNGPDDVDVTLYSLRKWAQLAAKGNPTALHFLFAGHADRHNTWQKIVKNTEAFLSRQSATQFLGFADDQLKRVTGEKGRGKKGHRPELEQEFGSQGKRLLDVACGSGGPALRIAQKTGCSLCGIDLHEDAISTAKSLAAHCGMTERADFMTANAAERLPFPDGHFDAITCIDAINHLPNRPQIVAEWARLLKARGRLLFTDPITVTGPLTGEEIAIRSSIGFFLFVPPDYDRSVIAQAGLRLLVCEDVTANMAELAERRGRARASRADVLREIEGERTYEAQQQFFEVAARLARERRLSRFLYVAEKPG